MAGKLLAPPFDEDRFGAGPHIACWLLQAGTAGPHSLTHPSVVGPGGVGHPSDVAPGVIHRGHLGIRGVLVVGVEDVDRGNGGKIGV